MVKAKEWRDIQQIEKNLRAIMNFPKTFGAILLKLAWWIEVIEAFKIPRNCFRSDAI